MRNQCDEKLEIASVRMDLRRESVEQQYDALVRTNNLQMAVSEESPRTTLVFLPRNKIFAKSIECRTRFIRSDLSDALQEAKARARVELLSEIYKKLNDTIMNRFSEQLSEVHLYEQISKFVQRFLNDPVDRFEPRGRKKPLTVSFPYIVYNLQDQEVDEDLAEIQQVVTQYSCKLIV